MQALGRGRDLNPQHRQAPQQGGDGTVHQGEFIAHEEGLGGEYRSGRDQALPQLFARLGGILLAFQDDVHQAIPIPIDPIHQQPRCGTGYRVHRQQGRMGKTLIQVLHDDAGFIESQIPVDQGRQGPVRIQFHQIFRHVERIDIFDLVGNVLFRQHDPDPMTVRIRRVRVKGHYRTLVSCRHGYLS